MPWDSMCIQNFFILGNAKVRYFAQQIAGKLVVAGQDKYMNNASYLIKTKNLKQWKTCRLQLKINKTQKLSDLINTALTEVQRIMTRKGDIKTLKKCIYVPTFLIIRVISI